MPCVGRHFTLCSITLHTICIVIETSFESHIYSHGLSICVVYAGGLEDFSHLLMLICTSVKLTNF